MEKQFVAFKVGTSFYCIDIMQVQEVIREDQITIMPNFPSFVEGVINLRGIITPVLSIDKRIKKTQEHIQADESDLSNIRKIKLIIVKVEGITLALIVDTLDKILTINENMVQDAEGLGNFSNHKMVSGIIQIQDIVYTVLDSYYALESEEAEQLTVQLK